MDRRTSWVGWAAALLVGAASLGVSVRAAADVPARVVQQGRLYSIDHNTGTDVANVQTLKCAVCMAPTSPCYTAAGTELCSQGFDRKYRGYYFGGHYTHPAGGGRFCVEGGVPGSGLQNSGSYVYVTAINDGQIGGYPATKALRCAVCCKQ